MSTCPKCAASIASNARFCTQCGTPIPACVPPDVANPCGDEVHAALAAANLLKLRGEWQAAIDKCMEVLALDQDNAAAHSILGDIYRDQGHVTEAIHWYKLALDLDPDSTADHIKLEQLISHSQGRRIPRRDRMAEIVTTGKRVVVEAALAIGVLLFITTLWPVVFRPRTESEIARNRPSTQAPQRVRLPITIDETATSGKAPVAPTVIERTMSSHEDALLQALNSSPALADRRLQVRSVFIDPRNRSAVVTFLCPKVTREPAPLSLIRGSLIVLRETCFKDHDLDRFTIRALDADVEGGPVEVRFVADAERISVLSINPEAAGQSELEAVVRDPWWAPGIR